MITFLAFLQDELESSIPSSSNINTTSQPTGPDPTRAHVRALRALLEKLDDLSKDRAELNARVVQLAATDDITPRVLKAASGMEQWVNVQPAMFEDILDEELSKFEKFRAQLDDDEQRQTELLRVVQVGPFRSCLSLFALGCIRSRRVMTLRHEWLG